MAHEQVDCLVIGAGVIGLAVARALALAGRAVIVAEAARTIGTETSSRNSEVIHAGLYYPENSYKARFCVAGRRALYRYCRERSIPHRACGKLIVATDSKQIPALQKLVAQAARNGVDDLHWLTPAQVHDMEPAIRCVAAMHSPSSGILDSHAYMLSLQGEAENAGAVFAFSSPVLAGRTDASGMLLQIGGEEPMELHAKTVVNCAGLHAVSLARRFQGLSAEHIPPFYYAKGNYYILPSRAPFRRLIYPLPEQAGLGVHVTLDLGGQARFGPDVEWVDGIDYRVDPRRADVFYPAIRRYWPDLADGELQPGYSGIRPKLQGPGQAAVDFLIQGPKVHGISGLINLFGIESPGLTASLAIAEHVLETSTET
ncbi:MAG: NAD(P)/FAD-dependent oxidoreductase [Gammaproteobacteria bacterium]|nr:NAD(P)/FAD-dependent oxidoreductase [Gammaproteobacteria bacterium]MCP5424426.1 NAD(P)/FAD-dependent oxidoreductase [Gammaproteobacteria bacterium]MCP5458420.1 NAD(P)/FAD-dependent oxidoreductase [Gammaproteobacteria bacterium]